MVNREIYSSCPAHLSCQWTQIADTELCRAHTIAQAGRPGQKSLGWTDSPHADVITVGGL